MSDRTTSKAVRGAVGGLVTGFGVGMLLFLFGAVDSDSAVITFMPVLFAGIGVALGVTQPIKRGADDDDGGEAALAEPAEPEVS